LKSKRSERDARRGRRNFKRNLRLTESLTRSQLLCYNKIMIENIYPEDWQQTRGFYSPAKKIDLGNAYLIYVSGQQVDKNENNEAITEDIEEQTELVFQAIEKILKAANASIDDVVKAQIFLTNINDFLRVSAIRDKWFAKNKPVSTLVEVNAMTRKGAKIEIEVTAVINK